MQNQKYHSIVSIRLYYDWHRYVYIYFWHSPTDILCSDALMEECVRMMSQSLRSSGTMKKKAKSVYNQRNLGTIKERKKEKRSEKEINNGEVIMRILRMRYVSSNMLLYCKLTPCIGRAPPTSLRSNYRLCTCRQSKSSSDRRPKRIG